MAPLVAVVETLGYTFVVHDRPDWQAQARDHLVRAGRLGQPAIATFFEPTFENQKFSGWKVKTRLAV